MTKIAKGKRVTVGGKTYKAGEDLPERHAKLLTIPVPKQTPKTEANKK